MGAGALARGRLGPAHEGDGDGGDQEGRRVEGDGDGRGERLDEEAGEAGSGDLGDGFGEGKLGIGGDEILALDERGDVGLIRHVEEDRQQTRYAGDDVELGHAERAAHRRDGDGGEDGGAAEVGEDEDGASFEAVRPRSGEEAEEEDGDSGDSAEDAHLEGSRAQDQDSNERKRGAGDAGADLRDRLAGPELYKLAVAPERHLDRIPRDTIEECGSVCVWSRWRRFAWAPRRCGGS